MIINIDFVYPIGALYLTTSVVSPQITFGGVWEQVTSDAYLKIVTSEAGSYGGTSSSHKIPIESMPYHEHLIRNNYGYIDTTSNGGTGSWGQKFNPSASGGTAVSSNFWKAIGTGGGQSYYPYYYGIYVWRRIA